MWLNKIMIDGLIAAVWVQSPKQTGLFPFAKALPLIEVFTENGWLCHMSGDLSEVKLAKGNVSMAFVSKPIEFVDIRMYYIEHSGNYYNGPYLSIATDLLVIFSGELNDTSSGSLKSFLNLKQYSI
jgi:hypothetical protein